MIIRRQAVDRLSNLFDTTTPLFGLITLWLLIGVSIYITTHTHLGYQGYEKGANVSVAGYILPANFFDWPYALKFLKPIFWLSSSAWALLPFLRFLRARTLQNLALILPWLSVLSYTLLVSVFWENLPWFRHKYVVPNWVMIYYALWFGFYRYDIAKAISHRNFWGNNTLYPRWAYLGSVFSIALLYSFGGISKMRAAGIEWGDGLSLQLWVEMMGDSSFPLTDFILSDRSNAQLLQGGVIILQSCAVLAVFPSLRSTIGLGLIAFQLSVELMFGIPFRSNVILIAAFFLPWYGVLQRLTKQFK